jgi:hypothetical protein
MAVTTLKGSRIITGITATPPTQADPGEGGGRVRCWVETIEVTAADDVSSTYHMARLPSNARILGISRIHWDDLATAGSPTLDIGVYNVGNASGITNDVDAINNGLDAATATTGAAFISGIENYGKKLYEFVNGQTSDPGGDLDIKLVLADAAVTTGGTVTCEIFYAID